MQTIMLNVDLDKLNKQSRTWVESYNYLMNPNHSIEYLRRLLKFTNVPNKHELLAMSEEYLNHLEVDVKFIFNEEQTNLDKMIIKYLDKAEYYTETFTCDEFKKEALFISGLFYFKALIEAVKRQPKKTSIKNFIAKSK